MGGTDLLCRPDFAAKEGWEHGSVYEPNLIYHDGKWRMWYVAVSKQENYLVHAYAESESGSAGWSQHKIFAEPELKMFDFCVRQRGAAFDAIFARMGGSRLTSARDLIVVVPGRRALESFVSLE